MDDLTPFSLAADLLDPPRHPHVDDPIGFCENTLGDTLWSKQREIAESVRDNPRTAVPSCFDSGKSFIAGRIAAWWMECHPPGEAVVITTAPTHDQIKGILWKEIGRAHRKGKLMGRVNQTEWWIGTAGQEEIVGIGRRPKDYDEAAFQGWHARYPLVIFDEADGIPKSLWDAAEGLVTNEDARWLSVGNPWDATGEFAKACKRGSGWNVIRIAAQNTPNFTGEDVPQHLHDLLLAKSWVKDKLTRWGEADPRYVSKVLARFPEAGSDSLIPMKWIVRAQKRRFKPTQPKELAADIARYGSDETVIAIRRGPWFRVIDAQHQEDTMETVGRISVALDDNGDVRVCKIDVVGIGAGVVDRLLELGKPVVGLNVGTRAMDPEQFFNARAEWHWRLRERFEEDKIDIDPDDEVLAEQLSQIKWRPDGSMGRIRIMSKEELRAKGLESPDRADTCMLAFAPVTYETLSRQEESNGQTSIMGPIMDEAKVGF